MAETDMAELGRQFKQLRRERRITLKEAAGAICSEATLSRFENGHSQLPADIFIALVERLHFDWRFFTVPD
ncbi:MAG: helix-turn-helix transcriptional regulator, partial [Schleiferilactobacillus harbinensis]